MKKRSETPQPAQPARQQCNLPDEHCITCSDEILTAQVLSVDSARGLALVQIAQVTAEVDILLLEHVAPGDTLLVHGGIALSLGG